MRKSLLLLVFFALILPLVFLGCEGDDGAQGPPGEQGLPGENATAAVSPESCSVCHQGEPRDGDAHQAAYDQLYQDGVIQVTGVGVTQPDANTVVTTFTMTKVGDAAFTCEDADSIGIYFTTYAGAGVWEQDGRLSLKAATNPPNGTTTTVAGAAGLCTVTTVFNDPFPIADLTTTDGIVVVYGRDEKVADNIPNSRVVQYKYPFAGLGVTGEFLIGDYTSAANTTGCEKCHTVPFLKHGYIYGEVAGNPANDFYTCKACHLDNGDGGHFIWQLLVSDQTLTGELYTQVVASGGEVEDYMTDAQKTLYAYKTRLMNDVHMSHSMEFAYPQSMSTCNTCHADKLNLILTDEKFELETCKSCHAVSGEGRDEQAPALATIWTNLNLLPIHQNFIDNPTVNVSCSNNINCHQTGGAGKSFSTIHTGYDKDIYTAGGTKYASEITVSIDSATLVGTDLTIEISAQGAAGDLDSTDITPAVLVGLYGYDTKDFIVNGHDRWDSNCNGTTSRSDGDQPIGEYVVGEEVAGCPNPYWTLEAGAPGSESWTITAHLGTWAAMITDGTIKKVEIAVLPETDPQVGLNAVSRTFDLTTGDFDDTFFGHDIVDVAKCNNCHDQLATTFHSGDRGGSVTVCRMCHVTLVGGSHLEMQSRSITSYVHAIHSFQAFDIGDIDFSNPFDALEYEHHIDSHFPTFGTEDCLACHNAGKFNVPDQSKSLPGVLSGSDFPVIFFDGLQRNIGEVPSYNVGPATLACGACHRAHEINEDAAGDLAALFSHWRTFGYLVEDGDIFSTIDVIFKSL